MIFHLMRELREDRESREARGEHESQSGEKEKPLAGHFGLEFHFHADARVRI